MLCWFQLTCYWYTSAYCADFTPALFDWTLNNITCKPQNHSAWRLDLISACSVCQYSLPALDSERFWCSARPRTRTNLFINDYAIKLKRLLINLQNGFIECEKDCPAVDDCYALVKKSPEICCDKCKGKFAFDRFLSWVSIKSRTTKASLE